MLGIRVDEESQPLDSLLPARHVATFRLVSKLENIFSNYIHTDPDVDFFFFGWIILIARDMNFNIYGHIVQDEKMEDGRP